MSQETYKLPKARALLLRTKRTYDNLELEIVETKAIIAAHPWSSIKKEADPEYCDDWRESKISRLRKEQDDTRILIEALHDYIKSLEEELRIKANSRILEKREVCYERE